MKTKALSLILCIAMLMSVCALAVGATEKPLHVTDKQLPILDAWVQELHHYNRLTDGLTSSDKKTNGWNATASPAFSDADKADIADTKYGISAYGIATTERPISKLVDGTWATGQDGTVIFADNNFYNMNGEVGKDDSIYKTVLTLNFGKMSQLAYVGWVAARDKCAAVADIFVSDDGETWTDVGYVDLIQQSMNGWGFNGTSAGYTDTTKDANNARNGDVPEMWINLGDNVTGQYMKICISATSTGTTSVDKNNYDANVKYNTQLWCRELIVLGANMNKPVAETELPIYTKDNLPTDLTWSRNLAAGLTSSASKGNFVQYDWWNGSLDAVRADVANTNYGISLIGALYSEKPVSSAVDGYLFTGWTNGGANGGFSARYDEYTYNVKGEKGKTDSIYEMLMTLNFGQIYNLDTLAFYAFGNMPSAADIYVSNDGQNWTAIGYYDLAQRKLEGKRIPYGIKTSDVFGADFKDATTTSDGNDLLMFDLGENVQAQYMRLAFTAHRSSGATTGDKYSDFIEDDYITNAYKDQGAHKDLVFRELMVFGDEPGVTYEGVQLSNAADDGSYDARFLATIDDLTYDKAGFEMKLTYYTATETAGVSSAVAPYYATVAYKGINIYDKGVFTDPYGNYIIAMTVSDIPAAVTKLVVELRTVYEEDGQTVYGDWYVVTLEAGKDPVQAKK